MNPWWTDQQAGLIGGIAGSAIGILGGIFGTVAGICVPRGKGKSFIFGIAALMIGVGIIALIVGVFAITQDQPYGVYYPLLLLGFICTTVMGSMFPVIRNRYREADSRRLEAEELRRS